MAVAADVLYKFTRYPSPISSVRLTIESVILLILCLVSAFFISDSPYLFAYAIVPSFYSLILLILSRVRRCSSKERVAAAHSSSTELPYILDLTQPSPIKEISPDLWRYRLHLYEHGHLSVDALTTIMAAGFNPDECFLL
jgi:hypothetical protein